MEKAIFGAGCFWGVEETFRILNGVIETRVGYLGGDLPNPTYEQVCANNTGHAEVVEIRFDQDKISYEQLVDIFFRSHNPTTLNRQGPDVGTQYRSAIFYTSKDQEEIAIRFKDAFEAKKIWAIPIVTEIQEASTFYPAEDYHQKYLMKRGLAHCHI